MKYRIIEIRGVYKIERKHWLFGWSPLSEDSVCTDGLVISEDITFRSVEEAEAYLNPPQPRIIKCL